MLLQCAEQLEARYKEDYSAVVWFLVTDSKTLRHWVRARRARRLAWSPHARRRHLHAARQGPAS